MSSGPEDAAAPSRAGGDVLPPRVHPRVFAKIPTVRDADEIVDSAFRRASRITVFQRDAFARLRATEQARIRSVQNSVANRLRQYVRRFPSFDGLPPFYQELVHLLFDLDRTRKALASLDWAAARVDEVGDDAAARIKRAPHKDVALEAKSHAYGRIASVLKQVDKDLKFLDEVRQRLRKLPVLEWDQPTLVVAGYPNVGKSSLVARVSSGTPEVNSYPFTTKGIIVGHFERDLQRYQIVDTPGLLDRAPTARNDIERQAIQALRHLADVIVFLVDPSEHCGYTLEEQRRLLAETRETFPGTPVVVAESKADLKTTGEGALAISTETGEGVDALVEAAVAAMPPRT